VKAWKQITEQLPQFILVNITTVVLQNKNTQLLYTPVYTHPFNGSLSRTIRTSQYQEGKNNLDLLEQWLNTYLFHQSMAAIRTPGLMFGRVWSHKWEGVRRVPDR